jgi:hypothetical protein
MLVPMLPLALAAAPISASTSLIAATALDFAVVVKLASVPTAAAAASALASTSLIAPTALPFSVVVKPARLPTFTSVASIVFVTTPLPMAALLSVTISCTVPLSLRYFNFPVDEKTADPSVGVAGVLPSSVITTTAMIRSYG